MGYAGSLVSGSYASGNVIGSRGAGGLIGYATTDSTANGGQAKLMTNTYATGSVTGILNSVGSGSEDIGGLIGNLGSPYGSGGAAITVSNSYSTGTLSGARNVGGLIGYANGNSSVNNSYWDTTTSGQSTSAGGTGKTTAQLKQIATFTGWDIADVSNTTSNSTWVIDENNSTPWLR